MPPHSAPSQASGPSPARATTTGAPLRGWVVASLVAMLLLGGVGRWITRDEPLELDLSVYATVAHEMLGGRQLYSDLWDHKPPAVHVTYAVAEVIAGYGMQSVLLLNVTTLWLTLVGCYLAGRALGGAFSGLASAATFLVLSFCLELQANQPNTEVFINACTVWAMWLVLRDMTANRPLGWWAAVAVGALVGLASLYKTIAVLPIASVLLFWSVWSGLGRSGRPSSRTFLACCVAGGVTLLMWVAVGGYFYFVGRWDAFYTCVFSYNKVYASGSMGVWAMLLGPVNCVFWVATGLALYLREPSESPTEIRTMLRYAMLTLAVGSALTVALPGYPYLHYAQLWFPVSAMLMAWLVTGAEPDSHGARATWDLRPVKALAVVLLPLAVRHAYFLATLSPEEWSDRKYGNVFVASRFVGLRLRTILEPGERYYHLGTLTGLYYYSGLSPVSGLIIHQPLKTYDYPYPPAPLSPPEIREPLLERLMNDLHQARPDLVTIESRDLALLRQYPRLQSHPLMAWLVSDYVLVPESVEDQTPLIRYLVRKGSNIERRLLAAPSEASPVPNPAQGPRP